MRWLRGGSLRNGIARDILHHDFRKFLPFLLALFSFILVNNWFGEFFLFMPQEAFEQSRLAPGHVVTAKPRAYGLQFTYADSQKAFFLVMDDEQHRELQTKVVTL